MARTLFSLVATAVLLACAGATAAAAPAPRTVVIDSDSANEIDDLYAIVRALLAPEIRVVAVSSAQWHTRISPEDTVLRSQTINEELVRLLGRRDVATPLGAEMIVGLPWGGTDPRNSAAAQFIIRAARAVPAGEKLTVVGLGATTNIASAIQLAPDIVPKLSCYVLAGKYYADRGVWDKDEFNVRNDLNAANLLFNTDGLDLHVMPVNILYEFKFQQQPTLDRLLGKGAVWEYLGNRWLSFAPSNTEWIMWDLALVEALVHPELARESEVAPPPENTGRKIHAYTSVDLTRMQADWWETAHRAQERGHG